MYIPMYAVNALHLLSQWFSYLVLGPHCPACFAAKLALHTANYLDQVLVNQKLEDSWNSSRARIAAKQTGQRGPRTKFENHSYETTMHRTVKRRVV